ncbi:Uncharacterized protein APZ42_024099 [Daphnia magna]|uniref:Uncharacterized protein n=1 Tax=Daphnia magna TaxID=35525 RepID=A0A164UFB1_9CRUS|nr:Uncharacterized protein APZ42_024099 [Daphnia magna]
MLEKKLKTFKLRNGTHLQTTRQQTRNVNTSSCGKTISLIKKMQLIQTTKVKLN